MAAWYGKLQLNFLWKLCIGKSIVKENFCLRENKLCGGVSRHTYPYLVATTHSGLITFSYLVGRMDLHIETRWLSFGWIIITATRITFKLNVVMLFLLNWCHCWKCLLYSYMLFLKKNSSDTWLVGCERLKCSCFICIYHVNLYKSKIL
jgi:hypothetical protein